MDEPDFPSATGRADARLQAQHASNASRLIPADPDETQQAATTDRAIQADLDDAVPRQIGKYEVQGRIARGGMGVVVRAYDPDLDRTLAIKIALACAAADDGGSRRFLDEARTTGKLQHPGIAPVHEVGHLPDGRPYLVMKLVGGRTLADILALPADTRPDLATLLDIFLQICRPVAYAHSQQVIHRDLKPVNVMVGAFGEVQVMDWGLAKTLSPDEAHVGDQRASSCGHVELSSFDGVVRERAVTHDGTVMGTPAYMPPEQARGEINATDKASDVFGLGAIMCEILTGQPPFQGDGPAVILARAAHGDLSGAFLRLDVCGADRALIELATRCLAPLQAERPQDAAHVARAIEDFQRQVQEKLRQAELQRAQAEVQMVEQQKRRVVERQRQRLWLSLAAVTLVLVCGAAGGTVWYQFDRADRQAEQTRLTQEKTARQQRVAGEVQGALDDVERWLADLATRLADEARASRLLSSIHEWQAMVSGAMAAHGRADQLAQVDLPALPEATCARLDHVRGQVAACQRQWQMAEEIDRIRTESTAPVRGGLARAMAEATQRYHDCFVAHDLSPFGTQEEAAEVATRIGQSPIRTALVAALDHWALVNLLQATYGRQKADVKATLVISARLLEVARLADPDPWRDQVRDVVVWLEDKEKLQTLAGSVDMEKQSPQLLDVVAKFLPNSEEVQFRRLALLYHPGDFYLTFNLAFALPLGPEREGCLQAALAVRPESAVAWNNLAWALAERAQWDRALVAAERSLAIDPSYVAALVNQGNALASLGRTAEAIEVLQRVIEMQTDPAELAASYANLALAQVFNREPERGLTSARRAVELGPGFANAQLALGFTLLELKRFAEAIDAYKAAAAIDASCQPRLAAAWRAVGTAQAESGAYDPAIEAYRASLNVEPQNVQTAANLVAVVRAALHAEITTEQEDRGPNDVEMRARHQRVLHWLTALSECLQAAREWPAADRDKLTQTLADWLRDESLADIRAPQWLKNASDDERAAWDAQWSLIEQFGQDRQ